ncbi:hypothetical protein VB780_12730 [Leptolyngbya sp. CCNP1308]|uniref:hypothetical protein n=1 Tax=Leptolyngbya sp. CCNP1308 TaxID=3110255 RepID=UPI002B21DF03|nr:hypothetical protein [Leptolyngbya sp. CCNP1308]MEA5449441.1 hypothetical protein [Leptolyngbya sp. CCNP1308]
MPINFSRMSTPNFISGLGRKNQGNQLRKYIAEYISYLYEPSINRVTKNVEKMYFETIKELKITDEMRLEIDKLLGTNASRKEIIEAFSSSTDARTGPLEKPMTASSILTLGILSAAVRMLSNSIYKPESPEVDNLTVHLTIADEYYKEELRYSLVYSAALTSAFLVQSFFISHNFYGGHLLLLVLACVIISRICLIKYRISKEFFGSSPHEAQLIIQYIIDNNEKIEPPDDGSMSVFPIYRSSEETASQTDLGLGGELA